ncbi:MAG: Na+/H+ antiporter NhaA, partial [bacterium]|nr:Na+/H+ antiporter NhaA [bacterium]
VLVIALFYTSNIIWLDIYIGAGVLAILIAGNWLGVRTPIFYGILGIGGLWLAFLLSGVHATVAGVLAAFAIPARTRFNAREYLDRGRTYLDDFETAHEPESNVLSNRAQLRALSQMSAAVEKAQTPLQRLEHALHPWVAFFIMPLFALANAGVAFGGNVGAAWVHPVSLGIIIGLFFGKQLGIFFFAWLSIKLGVGEKPYGVSWKELYGVSILGGIGFTMSLFIAGLAFRQAAMDDMAKMGILIASLLSAILGLAFLRAVLKPPVAE